MITMEFRKGYHLLLDPEIYRLRDSWYESARPALERKYGEVNESHLKNQLLLVILGLRRIGADDARGRTFLDLGCGSEESPDNSDDVFAPWLCRCLHELGGNVIGVDHADNSRERFTAVRRDLKQIDLKREV